MDMDVAEKVDRLARKELGVVLRAQRETDRVNGAVDTVHKAAGQPFAILTGYRVGANGVGVPFRAEVDDCPFCKATIPRENAHDCARARIYGQDLGPSRTRLSTLIDPHLDPQRRRYLDEIVDDFKRTA